MNKQRQEKMGQREKIAELSERLQEAETRVATIEKYLQSSGMVSVLDNYDYLISLARDLNNRLGEDENILRQMSAYHTLKERAMQEHLADEWPKFIGAVEVKMAEIVKRETEAHQAKQPAPPTPSEPTVTPSDIEKARQERIAKLNEGAGEP